MQGIILIGEEELFKICPHYVGVGERVVKDERFVIHLLRKTVRQVLQYSFSPISQTHKDFPSLQCHASTRQQQQLLLSFRVCPIYDKEFSHLLHKNCEA